jgi:hypothetical protein
MATNNKVIVLSEETNYSSIGYKFGVEVTEAQRDVLASLGLTILSQRSPAATADKVLGYAKGQTKSDYSRADYEKDNGGKWTRDAITFTPDNATAFEQILRDELANGKAKPFPMVVTGVNVFAKSTEGAMAEAMRSIRMFEQLGHEAVMSLAYKLGFVHDETTDLSTDNVEWVAVVAKSLKTQAKKS